MLVRFLFTVVTVMITSVAAAADDPIFSGPQPGERLAPLRVALAYGAERGQEVDLVASAAGRPTMLIIVSGANRPAARLSRVLLNYAEMRSDDRLKAALVWLDGDRSGAETYLQQAISWWGTGLPVGISLDGAEGPGSYGLNRNVNVTVLVANEGRVTANFALVQPSETDAPRILTSVAELLDAPDPIPNTAQVTYLSLPTWGRGDVALRRLVFDLLGADDAKAVRERAAAIDRYIASDEARRAELVQTAKYLSEGRTRIAGPGLAAMRRWAGNAPRQAVQVAARMQARSADSASGDTHSPSFTVDQVEVQPLLASVARLRQALEFLGHPLAPETAAALDRLEGNMDAAEVTAGVQRALDPYCAAAVEIDEDGTTRAGPLGDRPKLVEQGWSTHLVKVVNHAGATTTLRVDSPNALPVPGGSLEQVAERWMDLSPYTGRPLSPQLSGLLLEYRVLQIYSRDAGERTATLRFNVGQQQANNARTGVIRVWDFSKGTDGWTAVHDCEIAADGGILKVTSTGRDPYVIAPVEAAGGAMTLRFSAKFERSEPGQLFWATKQRPRPDGDRRINFPISGGVRREYAVPIRVSGDLASVRLDPGNGPGETEIDWISLAYDDEPGSAWANTEIAFNAVASTPVTFRVMNDRGEPTTAAFLIRDNEGRVYPAQAKRVAPDFYFHPQIYRANGESVRLPPGDYTVHCSHGPESLPETKTLHVGNEPVTLAYHARRWIDPAAFGWWSGDHHIHAAGCKHYENPTEGVLPIDMARHCVGEDLKVGCTLTWGPCFDYQKQFFTGAVDAASSYPYLLRYDIEVSGFGSHRSGHLCLLRLKDQMYPGGTSSDHWPTLGLNTLRWAKSQGAITGPAHSSIGLTNYVAKLEGREGPNGLPNFNLPRYDGIGANEFVVDVTHEVPGPDGTLVPAVDFISTMNTVRQAEWNMWYHVLNCGFRVRASGETDFPCISGDRVGIGRVYVKVDGPLNYDTWCEGIRQGRSYVSDGTCHVLDYAARPKDEPDRVVEVGTRGSELPLDEPGTIRLTAKVALGGEARRPLPVEVVVNAYPVASQEIANDGQLRDVTFDVPIDRSSWVAIRVGSSAHTNPIFVPVAGKPIRASKDSAAWCLRGVDQCWSQKKPTYQASELADAEAAYEHARVVYRRLVAECEAAE